MAAGAGTSRAGMVHLRRLEGGGVGMAGIALRAGRDMCTRFPLGGSAIVATGATSHHAWRDRRMVECGAGKGGKALGVAGIALQIGDGVFRWFGECVQRREGAVMAILTGSGRTGMVHLHGLEGRGTAMTGIALCACREVVRRFGQGIECHKATAMATCTSSGRTRMVHFRGLEGGGAGMTRITLRHSW